MAIEKLIGVPATLEQTAEEAAEFAQAALKMSRVLRGENPTPKTELEAFQDLSEELAHVLICIHELYDCFEPLKPNVDHNVLADKDRWMQQAQEKKGA
jgi:hypothetical protein